MNSLKEKPETTEKTVQRILVVDDENSISELIATSLRFVGFDVRTAATGSQALSVAEEFKPHALILDVMLPDQNGFDVCRQLRAEGHSVGVLFLTAKDTTEDKITGLTIGGDDYVTKPFSPRELVARIKSALRRLQAGNAPSEASLMVFRRIVIDDAARTVTVDEKPVELTAIEFNLLGRTGGHFLER